jgi:hypothetical protein
VHIGEALLLGVETVGVEDYPGVFWWPSQHHGLPFVD